MKLAIMQPYIFPYIGYYQLVQSADKFVVYDDVNYIKQGWINRNRVLLNNEPDFFTLPVKDASSFKKINETELNPKNYVFWKNKFYKTLDLNYRKAPFFEEAFTLVKNVLDTEDMNLARLASASVSKIMTYLDSTTAFVETAANYHNNDLKAQDRVLDICIKEKAGTYINPIGGMELYSKTDFAAQNIHLYFIKAKPVVYQQFKEPFHPWLSIIDVLMFNNKEQVKSFLNAYELI